MRHDYGEPAKMRQAIRAIEDVVAEHGFVLNVPPVRLGRTELSYLRIVDDVEILITSIGKPNVLEVLVYDRLRKRTWQDIKEKVEAAMASAQ